MSIDKTLFRQVLGSFASGVTVITTGREGQFHGMTANAFSSLSLEPSLVLVCVDKSAETLGVLQATGHFNVNILAPEQQHLSNSFAKKESPEAHGLHGVEYTLGKLGLPLLKDSLAHLECRVVATHEAGDHVIFVGEVDEADQRPEAEPLLYFRGKYGRVADA